MMCQGPERGDAPEVFFVTVGLGVQPQYIGFVVVDGIFVGQAAEAEAAAGGAGAVGGDHLRGMGQVFERGSIAVPVETCLIYSSGGGPERAVEGGAAVCNVGNAAGDHHRLSAFPRNPYFGDVYGVLHGAYAYESIVGGELEGLGVRGIPGEGHRGHEIPVRRAVVKVVRACVGSVAGVYIDGPGGVGGGGDGHGYFLQLAS